MSWKAIILSTWFGCFAIVQFASSSVQAQSTPSGPVTYCRGYSGFLKCLYDNDSMENNLGYCKRISQQIGGRCILEDSHPLESQEGSSLAAKAAMEAVLRKVLYEGRVKETRGDTSGARASYQAQLQKFEELSRAAREDDLERRLYRDVIYSVQEVIDRLPAGTDALSAPSATPQVAQDPQAAPSPAPAPTSVGAVAAQPPSIDLGHRVALVIGNGRYEHAAELPNPRNDAQAIASKLRALGFTDVQELHDLNLVALSGALKTFGDRASNSDWAVIYYAGHGIEVGGTNYLIPTDARLADASHVEDEAITLTRLLSKVEGARKMRLVMLDACRENPFAQNMRSAKGATRSIGRGLASIEPTGGVLVAYAARDGQLAADGDGVNSPFASAIIDMLEQPGLEINLFFRRVRDAVMQRTGLKQEPFTYGSLPAEEFYFAPPAGTPKPLSPADPAAANTDTAAELARLRTELETLKKANQQPLLPPSQQEATLSPSTGTAATAEGENGPFVGRWATSMAKCKEAFTTGINGDPDKLMFGRSTASMGWLECSFPGAVPDGPRSQKIVANCKGYGEEYYFTLVHTDGLITKTLGVAKSGTGKLFSNPAPLKKCDVP